MPWLLSTLACGWLGPSGELWLRIDHTEPAGDRVTLILPATVLRETGEPALLETAGGPVDLRPEARRLRRGDQRVWSLGEGGTIATLSHAAPVEGATSEIAIGVSGKRGNVGLSLTVPLRPEDLDPVRERARVGVDLDLPVALDAAACAQWRRSPPTPILEIVGPKGNGLRASTR